MKNDTTTRAEAQAARTSRERAERLAVWFRRIDYSEAAAVCRDYLALLDTLNELVESLEELPVIIDDMVHEPRLFRAYTDAYNVVKGGRE